MGSLTRLLPQFNTRYVSQSRTVLAVGLDGFVDEGTEHGLFVHETAPPVELSMAHRRSAAAPDRALQCRAAHISRCARDAELGIVRRNTEAE